MHPIFLMIISFFLVLPLNAQVISDPYQPFHEGETLNLHGVAQYLGDLPPDIQRFTQNQEFHSIAGEGVNLLGWDPFNSNADSNIEYFSQSPGLFFEDIPNPFGARPYLLNLPGGWTADWFGLPSSAWWGPEGNRGALVIREPKLQDESHFRFSGGIEGNISENGFLEVNSKNYGISASMRQTNTEKAASSFLSSGFQATTLPYQDSNWKLSLSGMALQESSNIYWDVIDSPLSWDDGEWFSARLAPYFAASSDGNQTVEEGGGRLDGLINFAGLVQSQWGVGLTFQNWHSSGLNNQVQSGFVQNSEWLDAIGVLSAHGVFRFDFNDNDPTQFNWLGGLKLLQDDWNVFLEGAKSVVKTGDDLQLEAGLGCQHNDQWRCHLEYLHLELPGGNLDGGRGQIDLNMFFPSTFFASSLKLGFSSEGLLNTQGNWGVDSEIEFNVYFPDKSSIWALLRNLDGNDWRWEMGSEWRFQTSTGFYAYLVQSPSDDYSWPDPGFSSPTSGGLGVRGEF